MEETYYCGYHIDYNGQRPVTGTWRAERHGVGMCAGDYDSLIKMIDAKVMNAVQERHKRDYP